MANDQKTPSDITARGDQIVTGNLKNNFYQTKVDTLLPDGSSYIEAVEASSGARILVQPKTAVGSVPSGLSDEELRNIKSRAAAVGADPYLAKVRLDDLLNPSEPVSFIKL